MGRLKCTRKGLQSTKQLPPLIVADNPLDPPRSHTDSKHEIGVSAFQLDNLDGLICTDLPGHFHFISSRGNNHIFVMYDFDSNTILAEPIKSRKTKHLIKGFTSCHKQITAAGITHILLRLHNDISSDLIDAIHSKIVKYQLANAYGHRHNLAERAIQTFKAHFVSITNGCNVRLPPHLWCHLIPQTKQTLNLLRRSQIHLKLSAYNQIYWLFDFNSNPLAPLGTKVIVYEPKPQQISTWSECGQHG